MERITPQRVYEFLFLGRGGLTKEAGEALSQSIVTIIKAEGGELIETNVRRPGPLRDGAPNGGGGLAERLASNRDVPLPETLRAGEVADPERVWSVLEPRRLSYQIKKEPNALVGMLTFRASPDLPKRLAGALRHNEALLRYCLTKKRLRRTKPAAIQSAFDRFEPPRETTRSGPTDARTVPLTDQSPGAEPDTAPTTPAEIDRKLEEIIG